MICTTRVSRVPWIYDRLACKHIYDYAVKCLRNAKYKILLFLLVNERRDFNSAFPGSFRRFFPYAAPLSCVVERKLTKVTGMVCEVYFSVGITHALIAGNFVRTRQSWASYVASMWNADENCSLETSLTHVIKRILDNSSKNCEFLAFALCTW